jgi:tripartite-type tricarboxylate transporter receptor subunit TctC
MRSIGFIFALAAGVACAQGYPAKPIRRIRPVPAGSWIDVVARAKDKA